MKYNVFYLFLIWIILVLGCGLSMCLYLLSVPSTICNVLGIIIVCILIFISEKTKCFTNFKCHEKNSNNFDASFNDSEL